MKKIIIRIALALIVVVAIGLWQIGSIVGAALATAGPPVVGADIHLGGVSVNPFTGKLTISDFILGNPEGFNTDHAMAFEKVEVDLSLASLMSDTIVIDRIEIAAPQITFEGSLSGSNLSRIQENIEAFLGKSDKKPEPAEGEEPAEESGPGKDVQIREFVMTDAKVSLSMKLLQGGKGSLVVPEIRHENIGTKDGGVNAAKAVGLVFSSIFQAVFSGVTRLLGNVADGVQAVGEGVLEGGKKAGEVIGDGVKGVGEGIGDGVKGIGDGIKGIFKKD